MDGMHANGMWFSSWENSLLWFLIGGEKKQKHSKAHENLLVHNRQKLHIHFALHVLAYVFFFCLFVCLFIQLSLLNACCTYSPLHHYANIPLWI